MQIYLARNNQQAGPYTLEQLNQMLASQQVLLTDLAWHQGMQEWKALGELTQGKLVYEPTGQNNSVPPVPVKPIETAQSPITRVQVKKGQQSSSLASLGKRALAKIFDLLLWLPAVVIPLFFLSPGDNEKMVKLQEEFMSAIMRGDSTEKVSQLQSQIFGIFPDTAWQMVIVYIVIMLIIQAFLLGKTGQSIGKKLFNIKIVDAETGADVNLMRAFTLRSMIFILLNWVLAPIITILDLIFAFGEKRQTLHDKLAKTKVINK